MGTCLGCRPRVVDASVLMIGLDGAGKTTILKQLKQEQALETVPTIGFHVDRIQFSGLDMTIWDIGGQSSLRELWKHYFQNVQAIVFVVDTNDVDRMTGKEHKGDACVQYWIDTLSATPELKNCIFLILANKQDQPSSLSTNQVIDALNLVGTLRGKQWHVQPTVAIANEGIEGAFNWLNVALQNRQFGKL